VPLVDAKASAPSAFVTVTWDVAMNAPRWLAVAVGTLLGSLVSTAVGLTPGTQRQLQAARKLPNSDLELLREDREGPSCAARSAMTVTRADGRVLAVPEKRREVGKTGATVYAAFSGSWAETRSVFFILEKATIQVGARFDTDHGLYLGTLDGDESSSVHVHPDALCFDLAVRCRGGSNALERWQGRLGLE
jgi:hypothetical protein